MSAILLKKKALNILFVSTFYSIFVYYIFPFGNIYVKALLRVFFALESRANIVPIAFSATSNKYSLLCNILNPFYIVNGSLFHPVIVKS